MTKEEAKKIIEYTFLNADGHLKPLDFDYGGGKGIVEALRMAIEALSQPSLPSNLDEAADTFNREDAARMWDYEGKTEGEIVEAAFKAGAERMVGQGYTFETIMQEDDVDELVPTCPDMYNHGYSCSDKVIVQIRRK